MFALEPLRDLYRHMEWADADVWRAARGLGEGTPDARLRDLLFHIHLTQRAFLQVWTGQRVELPKTEDFPTLPAVLAWARPYYGQVATLLDGVKDADLGRPMNVPWAKHYAARAGRQPDATTLGETLFQVTSHTTYHRGQVNRRLRELEVEPPLVDYIAWVWLGRPEPSWP